MADPPEEHPPFPKSIAPYNANSAANCTLVDALSTATRALTSWGDGGLAEGHLDVLRLAAISIGAPVGCCSSLSSSKSPLVCELELAEPEITAPATSSPAKKTTKKKKKKKKKQKKKKKKKRKKKSYLHVSVFFPA